MTGAEMLETLRFLIQEDTEDFFEDDKLLRIINLKMKMWASYLRKTNWYVSSATITLAAGERTEALPAGCDGHVFCIQDETNGDLFFSKKFVRHNPTDEGTPRWFDILNNTIYFDKKVTSASSYVLYYYRSPTTVADNTTEVDFPPTCQEIIVLDAAVLCKIRDGTELGDIVGERENLRGHLHQWMLDNSNAPAGIDMFGEMYNDGN